MVTQAEATETDRDREGISETNGPPDGSCPAETFMKPYDPLFLSVFPPPPSLSISLFLSLWRALSVSLSLSSYLSLSLSPSLFSPLLPCPPCPALPQVTG